MQTEKNRESLVVEKNQILISEDAPRPDLKRINIILGVIMVLFVLFTILSVYVILHQPPNGVNENSMYQGYVAPLHTIAQTTFIR